MNMSELNINHLYILNNIFEDKLNGDRLSSNSNINIEFIKKNIKNWNCEILSEHKNITSEIIKDNPNLPWRWDWISINPNITIDFIKENLDKDWKWRCISSHKNITCEDIRSEEHTSELQSRENLVCRLLLEKKKQNVSRVLST